MNFVFDAEHITVINAGMIILLQVFVSRIVRDRPALPTMVAGMVLGGIGFLCLAISQSAWMLILGIAVFSIGEMTAHPKYYSFVGLIAPQDRKAVYMGYSFLYGILGSLLGSNIGAFLYERILKPVIGMPEAGGAGAAVLARSSSARRARRAAGLIVFTAPSARTRPRRAAARARVIASLYAGYPAAGRRVPVTAFSSRRRSTARRCRPASSSRWAAAGCS